MENPNMPNGRGDEFRSRRWCNGELYTVHRPGYPAKQVGKPEVAHWRAHLDGLGVKTILCLLSDKQLAYYESVPGGLLEYYCQEGFTVIHRPVEDHQYPPVSVPALAQCYSDFLAAERPILIHCSAGMDRSPAVAQYIQERFAEPPPGQALAPETAEDQATTLPTKPQSPTSAVSEACGSGNVPVAPHLPRNAREQQPCGLRFDLDEIRRRISIILEPHPKWLHEFELLFNRAEDDPRMAVARARNLVEWLVTERHPVPVRPGMADGTLYGRLFVLARSPDISPVFVSLAHRVRMDGNLALHYNPKFGGFAQFSKSDAGATVARIAELVEREFAADWSIYAQALPAPHRATYSYFVNVWRPVLKNCQGKHFHLFGILDLMLRGALARMDGLSFDLLRNYDANQILAKRLPAQEETTLRKMRNLGIIGHDKESLFSPVRSTAVSIKGRGKVLLALMRQQSPTSGAVESAAREVETDLAYLAENEDLVRALKKARKHPEVTPENREALRELRNLNLLSHPAPLLSNSKKVRLTELADYIVGQATPDPR